MSNLLHRLGDALERAKARLSFAFDALVGRMPIPTPLERTTIMTIFARLEALEAANAAQSAINANVSAATDAATAATSAVSDLTDRVGNIEAEIGSETAPTPAPPPVEIDQNTGQPVDAPVA